MFNMSTLTKYIIILTITVPASQFTVSGASAQEDQEERIKKMGFVSISEKDEEKTEPVQKRIPQPKVINIPPKLNNPYVKAGSKSSAKKKISKQDQLVTSSSFVELESPIVVYADNQKVIDTPEKETFEVALSDNEIKQPASPVFGKETDKKKDYAFQAEPIEHKEEAYNFYNYDPNEMNFKSVDLNNTGIKTVSANDLVRQEDPSNSIDLNYKTKNEYQGVPLIDANVSVTSGYRVDDLDWNIAGDLSGANPNILSELTWDDLHMIELKGKVNVVLAKYLVIDGKAGWGEIIDGKNQDSDYDGDNRTEEFSRSNNATDDGHVWDYSVGGGVRVPVENLGYLFIEDNLWIGLLGGYSKHKQHLVITDLNQTIPDLGPFPGLDSRYSAQWEGPWVGVEVSGTIRRWRGWGRFEYHFPEYQGDATWNLREEFVQPGSFIHSSDDGRGIVFEGGGNYQLTDMWSFALTFTLQDWEMNPGIDRVYFTDGTVIDTRLNEVNWDSLSLTFGLTARF